MENHEKWMELCAPASKEQDPAKLLALTQEIARLLEEKEQRVKEIHRHLKEQGQGERQRLQSVRPDLRVSSHIQE